MSKLRIPLLAAAALLPTIASAQPAPGPDGADRPNRRYDRAAPPPAAAQQPGPQGAGQPGPGPGARPDRGPDGRPDRGPGGWDRRGNAGDGDRRGGDQFRGGDDRRGFAPGNPGRPDRPGPGGYGDRANSWQGRDGPRDWNDRGPNGDRRNFAGRPGGFDARNGNDGRGWNGGRGAGNWRGDRRYDWRGWRDHNRGLFHGPRYVAPRGYGYRPFSVGFRLDPFFYSQSYWLTDPYQYRLPAAEGPYRWVRYFDDVLLVDLRTGQVVDVINQFFW